MKKSVKNLCLKFGAKEDKNSFVLKTKIGTLLVTDLKDDEFIENKLLTALTDPYITIFPKELISGVRCLDIGINMFEQNIIDPLKVTRCALENAVSVAKVILSTEAIVLNSKEWMK